MVIAALLLIVASLGSGPEFNRRERSGSNGAVNALAIRVGLSIALFLFRIAGFYFGLIPSLLTPHSVSA